MTDLLRLQSDRINANLAPYDDTRGQAANTMRLRDDPSYLFRWCIFEQARLAAVHIDDFQGGTITVDELHDALGSILKEVPLP